MQPRHENAAAEQNLHLFDQMEVPMDAHRPTRRRNEVTA